MEKEDKLIKFNEYRKCLLSLQISVMLFGLSAILGRLINTPAIIVAGGRVICSSILLLLITLLSKTPIRLSQKKDYKITTFAGIILAIHWTTFFQSIQNSSVAIGTITFSTFPLFLTFLEPLIFHEKFKTQNILSAIVLLLGVFITVPKFSIENHVTVGILWGIVSSLSYAILSLANRYLSSNYPTRTICLYEQGVTAIALLPFLFLVETNSSPQNLLVIAAIGFVCTAFAHTLYVSAQKKVYAQTAGIISSMETVYGVIYAFIFLGEIPTNREIVGGVIILCVVLLSSFKLSKQTS